MNPVRCPKCGKINDGTTYFCIYCGTIFEDYKTDNDSIPPISLSIEKSEDKNKENPNGFNPNEFNPNNIPRRSNHRIAIILGYFFSIMGGLMGLFGLLIAIYLITRKDPIVKKHGKIQIGIFIFWIVVIGIMILSGALKPQILFTPMNFTSMQNMSTLNTSLNMTNLNMTNLNMTNLNMTNLNMSLF